MTRISSQALMSGLIAGMLALWWTTLHRSDQEVLISAAGLLLIGLSFLLERLWPFDVTWNQSHGDAAGDLGSAVLMMGVVDPVMKVLVPVLVVWLLPSSWAEQGPLAALPLGAQLLIAILLVELGAWGSHWAHHHFGPLWALHAMHHSPERLYTLNNFRFHPLNHALNHLALFLPVLLLGVSPQAIIGYVAVSLPVLVLQHANVDFRLGVLEKIINTNTLHRWHHSSAPAEGTANLGRALVIWDRLFGTYVNPSDRASPDALGLFETSRGYPGPARFWAQLAYPFSRACCARN